MNTAPTKQISEARYITRHAQQQIKDKTGMKVKLLLCPTDTHMTPEQMLRIIATSLDMSPNCFTLKTRTRSVTELRFIAAVLLRNHYPEITLQQIATLFGGQDHSSVINGIARANNLMYTGDLRFTVKYKTALHDVNQWLRKVA